jgi:hypothetical protein
MLEFRGFQAYPMQGIVTTAQCVGEGRTVIALRSYPGGEKIPLLHNWTLVDAALATTAAPGFFKRHSITKGRHRFLFEDAGAHRTNNPTKFALEECRRLDKAEQGLGATNDCLFISLGTGTRSGTVDPENAGFFGFHRSMASTFARYGTDVTDVHKFMESEAKSNPNMYVKVVSIEWESHRTALTSKLDHIIV